MGEKQAERRGPELHSARPPPPCRPGKLGLPWTCSGGPDAVVSHSRCWPQHHEPSASGTPGRCRLGNTVARQGLRTNGDPVWLESPNHLPRNRKLCRGSAWITQRAVAVRGSPPCRFERTKSLVGPGLVIATA